MVIKQLLKKYDISNYMIIGTTNIFFFITTKNNFLMKKNFFLFKLYIAVNS